MLNFKLQTRAGLDNFSKDYNGLSIREIADLKILSVAASDSNSEKASNALQSCCGVSWPDIGQCTSNGDHRCLGLQADQVFLLSTDDDTAHRKRAVDLANSAYVTDQSDSWVAVELTGSRCREVLERICPIDLHADVFKETRVVRTAMEHLNVVIFRNDDDGGDAFVLLSPRSSAESFLHALTESEAYTEYTE